MTTSLWKYITELKDQTAERKDLAYSFDRMGDYETAERYYRDVRILEATIERLEAIAMEAATAEYRASQEGK